MFFKYWLFFCLLVLMVSTLSLRDHRKYKEMKEPIEGPVHNLLIGVPGRMTSRYYNGRLRNVYNDRSSHTDRWNEMALTGVDRVPRRKKYRRRNGRLRRVYLHQW